MKSGRLGCSVRPAPKERTDSERGKDRSPSNTAVVLAVSKCLRSATPVSVELFLKGVDLHKGSGFGRASRNPATVMGTGNDLVNCVSPTDLEFPRLLKKDRLRWRGWELDVIR